jgi:hypothetical protein
MKKLMCSLLPPSPPAEKANARQEQAGQAPGTAGYLFPEKASF